MKTVVAILAVFCSCNFATAQQGTSADKQEDWRAAELPGSYSRQPVLNNYHEGRITLDKENGFRWINKAGVSWSLALDPSGQFLATSEDNPYFKNGQTSFELLWAGKKVQGFRFGNEVYVREGMQLLTQRSGGLKGYISADLASTPKEYGYGVSFYVSVWSLLEEPLEGFQIGLPSTWILPENEDFQKPLCPPGTFARDNWPERGPTWSSVFQTIEGGLGFWVSTRFPSRIPKYRINGTPNGYNHEISSPGWGFGKTEALKPDETGIAQLSNRLLVPPDGLTFEASSNGGVFGNAWMALPLVPPQIVEGTPTGDQSWTLFFNSRTFRGPVAFWLPETWSRLSQNYDTIHGRGLDARTGLMGGGAMEINTVPYFESNNKDGLSYTKLPRIQFPVDDEGRTFFMQDVRLYSQATLYKSVKQWFKNRRAISGKFAEAGTFRPELKASKLSLQQGPENRDLAGLEDLVETAVYEVGDSQAYGLRWKQGTKQMTGELPVYWKQKNDKMVPVPAGEVPAETALLDQSFAIPKSFPAYEVPPQSEQDWSIMDSRLGPFTADLSDGSRVTYAWFRFIDQPVLRRTAWTQETREQLQAIVEMMHRDWPIDGQYLANPGRGELAELDPAQLVTPPRGFEVGYVPIVLSQHKR